MPHDSPFEIARKQIEFTRNYTLRLLEDIGHREWFDQPPGCPSHIAWQVGHLAMSQYMLTLFRLRGKQPEDAALISKPFLRQFQKGSTPDSDPGKYPSAASIQDVFMGVHAQVSRELGDYHDGALHDTVIEPYAIYNTKLGSLYYCATHEMLHAGQIGLIRRLLGKPPRG